MRGSLPIAMVTMLGLGSLVKAGVAPLGGEIQVNSYTTGDQFIPSVAVGAAGDFVVVWVSREQDGSGAGVFGQIFDSAGGRVGGEFQVNTYTTGYQYNPRVAVSDLGGFVVVWQSPQDGSATGPFGQIFNSVGGRVGAEFQVNTYTTGYQYAPGVAMSGSGDFVVVWESPQDGGGYGVVAQRFGVGGARVGAEFQNTYITNTQYDAAVAMSGIGEFVVAWISAYQNGFYNGVFGQKFDSAGDPVGAEFQVSASTTATNRFPVVAMNPVGRFVVAWRGSDDGSYAGSFGRLFDSGGGAVGAEFQTNTYTTGDQSVPVVAMIGGGDFVVAWHSRQDGGDYGILGQSFDADGSPRGGEFQVNSYTTGYQLSPSMAANGAGSFVVAWNSNGQDGSGSAIEARRMFSEGPALTSPLHGATLDCSNPALIRPTFTWDTGLGNRFKVFMGSSAGFEQGTSATSGDQKIVTGSWTPSKKKWKNACNRALTQAVDPNDPVMYIAVEGLDPDVAKNSPLRKVLSFPVAVHVTD